MWDLPGPGLDPVAPALAGGFLTTAPPGKSKEGGLEGRDLGDVTVEQNEDEDSGEGLPE